MTTTNIQKDFLQTFSDKTNIFFSKKYYLDVLEKLYLARFMDKKMNLLVKQNKGSSFFLSTAGHEMVGTVFSMFLNPKDDWSFPYYRDRAFVLGLGADPVDIMSAFLARKSTHHSRGRMMLDHFSDKDLNIPCQSSCVGSQYLQAVGMAKAVSFRKSDEIVYVSGGEGSTSQGDFHEALNFASIHNLPIIFVIQNNSWAISVPIKEQTAGSSIAPIARGYKGLQVFEVDGCDYCGLVKSVAQSVNKARLKKGPSLIVANVPRLNSHTNSDDQKKYKDEKLIEEERKNDPIIRFEKELLQKGFINDNDLQNLKNIITEKVENISIEAEKTPFPEKHTATDHVFKDFIYPESSKEEEGNVIVMSDAINHALIEEMQRDDNVVVFGQDVAYKKGGVFGITHTLSDKFGNERCFNTPLAESTIVGLAIGMSQAGLHKPVAEIQFIDFSWTGMNQIVNELASIHYRSDGEWNCPIVIRMPYGGYIQGGPHHSQSIEALFAHIPGLKIVVPSNAADAKRLLKTAIHDPNPVIFLEHKALYRQHVFCARKETGKDEFLPFGVANIVKEGSDITFVGWGMMIAMVNEIAEKLEKEGISVEVIDLRTLVPLDMTTVLNSLKKTSKILIAHEAPLNCGFGAELAARVSEEGFCYLDAPIKRVCAKDCHVPFCADLEYEVLPQKEDLEKALRELFSY